MSNITPQATVTTAERHRKAVVSHGIIVSECIKDPEATHKLSTPHRQAINHAAIGTVGEVMEFYGAICDGDSEGVINEGGDVLFYLRDIENRLHLGDHSFLFGNDADRPHKLTFLEINRELEEYLTGPLEIKDTDCNGPTMTVRILFAAANKLLDVSKQFVVYGKQLTEQDLQHISACSGLIRRAVCQLALAYAHMHLQDSEDRRDVEMVLIASNILKLQRRHPTGKYSDEAQIAKADGNVTLFAAPQSITSSADDREKDAKDEDLGSGFVNDNHSLDPDSDFNEPLGERDPACNLGGECESCQ